MNTSVYSYMDNKFKVELTRPSGPKFYMGDFYSQGTAQAEYKVRHFQNIAREVGTDYPGHTAKVVPA
ncbi:MAG TPA: hypothetical protein VHW23_15525 [Kofleriaceae bacterium]|nr:hypothetical protein [Kofleriaceae bacterium]